MMPHDKTLQSSNDPAVAGENITKAPAVSNVPVNLSHYSSYQHATVPHVCVCVHAFLSSTTHLILSFLFPIRGPVRGEFSQVERVNIFPHCLFYSTK